MCSNSLIFCGFLKSQSQTCTQLTNHLEGKQWLNMPYMYINFSEYTNPSFLTMRNSILLVLSLHMLIMKFPKLYYVRPQVNTNIKRNTMPLQSLTTL